ncbi:MAG TPA: hypothetical protein GX735_06625 [Firmicutes bacterium]|jgi:hypothetical protein|nr:hypothetical protein [Bacillota bacterium]
MGEEKLRNKIRLKFRFDYRGTVKPGRFLFWSGKNTERIAEETREQQIALLRNVPLQGVTIEDVDLSHDIYRVYDEELGTEVAFAPAEVVVNIDSLEEAVRFIMREEFRKVEVMEPEEFDLSRYQLERLLFKLNTELRSFIYSLQNPRRR